VLCWECQFSSKKVCCANSFVSSFSLVRQMSGLLLLFCFGLALAQDPAPSWLAYAKTTCAGQVTRVSANTVVPPKPTSQGAYTAWWFGIEDPNNINLIQVKCFVNIMGGFFFILICFASRSFPRGPNVATTTIIASSTSSTDGTEASIGTVKREGKKKTMKLKSLFQGKQVTVKV
jgi:hypothetical protein